MAMAKFKYFAYGSNMLTEWLKVRCPSAVPVAIAKVMNFSVEFSKRSIDNSGKATLIGSEQHFFGVVFEIDNVDQRRLDDAEGEGYIRVDNFPVYLVDYRTINTRIYLASKPEANLKPYDWYLALVLAGAREHNLEQDYVASLHQVAYEYDPDIDRKGRKRSIEILKRLGFANYKNLLIET